LHCNSGPLTALLTRCGTAIVLGRRVVCTPCWRRARQMGIREWTVGRSTPWKWAGLYRKSGKTKWLQPYPGAVRPPQGQTPAQSALLYRFVGIL